MAHPTEGTWDGAEYTHTGYVQSCMWSYRQRTNGQARAHMLVLTHTERGL